MWRSNKCALWLVLLLMRRRRCVITSITIPTSRYLIHTLLMLMDQRLLLRKMSRLHLTDGIIAHQLFNGLFQGAPAALVHKLQYVGVGGGEDALEEVPGRELAEKLT